MLDSLDAAAVRRWCAGGLAALRRHQGEIDELNVYPVPDGDTGTNLVLTLTSAQQALAGARHAPPRATPTAHGRVLRLMARGALLGARGNSGVIVSQILRGLADALAVVPAVDAAGRWPAALRAARRRRLRARSPSRSRARCSRGRGRRGRGAERRRTATTCRTVVRRRRPAAAAEALARTPEQLPALARAGVVDAGGRGLCVLLDALVEVVTGRARRRPARRPRRARAARRPPSPGRPAPPSTRYEVQYLLDAGTSRRSSGCGGARRRSATRWSSSATAGADGTWNVHVHVNDVGAAIEAGVDGRAGRTGSRSPASPTRCAAGRPGAGRDRGRASWSSRPAPGSPSSSPPRARRWWPAATRPPPSCSPRSGPPAPAGSWCCPTTPTPQAVAGAAAARGARPTASGSAWCRPARRCRRWPRSPSATRRRRFDDDVIAMAEAAGACRYAEVTIASREALTVAGRCQPGDVLALVEGEVQPDRQRPRRRPARAAARPDARRRRRAGHAGHRRGRAGRARRRRCAAHVAATLAVRRGAARTTGGQPHYPLLVGVE